MPRYNVAIRNCSGIPIVDFAGRIDTSALDALKDMLRRLVQAGHYNAVLNLKKAKWTKLDAITQLDELAALFATHYGSLGVIAELEQIVMMRSGAFGGPTHLLQFCTSESQAVTRIKRLPDTEPVSVQPTPAKLADSK